MFAECVVVTPANFKRYLYYCCRSKSSFDRLLLNTLCCMIIALAKRL